MIKLLLCILFFFSARTFSNEKEEQRAIMKIHMLDEDNKIAVLRYPLGLILKRTSTFEITSGFGQTCQATLLKNTKSFALFDMSDCMAENYLFEKQKLRVVSKRSLKLESTVLKRLERQEGIDSAFEEGERWLNTTKKKKRHKEKEIFGSEIVPSTFSSKKIKKKLKRYNKEKWYMNVGFSKISTSYDGELQKDLDLLEAEYGSTQTSYSLDGGIYNPINDGRSLFGFAAIYLLDIRNGGTENSASNVTVNSVQTITSQVLVGASYLRFLGQKRTGYGLFFRGDLGISLYDGSSNQDLNISGLDTTVVTSYSYSPGMGYLVGGGYAFEWDDGKSVLLEINYLKTSATLSSKTSVTTVSGVESESEEELGESVSATNILFKIGLFF